ncbi:6-hydroxymethylpterin diphosphokinase MptE-like protein [Halorarius halobius]|uniref:6-hydroxymethylpterin diphosphokinase MptE-like protein n=1 Tax=Halorarius halobius TaxID=2962671 RepID=UPI0020CE9157|nr:6-hydroxymethylpterin diphosphokinase MptE-like protein [Halorarius halobius]
MQFDTWEPVYRRILADFGYDRESDERARDVLADLVGPFDHARLEFLDGATVAVCGAAPTLGGELHVAREADAVVAASTAADVCREAGVDVDLLVTDLDKNPETARALTDSGVPVAAHAHGDNVGLVRDHVPTFAPEWTLPTTQAEPRGPVENFGGFTDGDRAAFLADEFGAADLLFPGWAFDDPAVGDEKARKLAWAERLLYWLERRRGERFAVLDGRRDDIDTSVLPPEFR